MKNESILSIFKLEIMDNRVYGCVLFMLSHYTEDVIQWLYPRRDSKFYKMLYDKLKNHMEMITPISYYIQLCEMIRCHDKIEEFEKIVNVLIDMYEKRRK